jgi:hypothetical protein
MLAKEVKEFIDLRDKPDVATAVESPMMKEPDPRGPMVYISDFDLPLTDDDLNQAITATVKIKPRRITTTIDNGKKRTSYDLEVVGIKF